jgi:hypothetical protein
VVRGEEEAINVKGWGYDKPVAPKPSSPALNYFLLLFLGGVCAGVMFKNAKRTHLD